MTLGERLIQLRAKAGLSQDTLAEQLGVSRQSVSKWENDASVPDLEKLVKLSGVFGVSLDELVKGEVPDSAAPAVKAGVTAEELRLHRQRLLGLLLLLASVLLGARSEGCAGALWAFSALGAHGWHILSPWVHPYFIFSKEHVSTILWRLP